MTAKTYDFTNLLYYNPAAQGFNPVISASVSPDNYDPNEGDSVTFTVDTWNVADNTTLYWKVANLVNLTTGRFINGTDGPVTITNKRGSFVNGIDANNETATGVQTYDIIVSKVLNGPALATLTVTVNDTSQDLQLLVMDLDPKNYVPASSSTITVTTTFSSDYAGGFPPPNTGGSYVRYNGDIATQPSVGDTFDWNGTTRTIAQVMGFETYGASYQYYFIGFYPSVGQGEIGIGQSIDITHGNDGLSITDASGQSHPGVLVNGVSYSGSGDNSYFVLDGTNDYINVPSLQNSAYKSVTMMLWFNPANSSGSLITKELSYKMRLASSHLNVGATHTGSAPWVYGTTDNSITFDNNWHHVAVTIAPDFIDWYYDGNSFHHEAGIGTLGANAQPLMIGSYGQGTSEFFTGKIGPARLYNYALTSGEVSTYFNNTRSRYQVAEPNSLIFNGSSDYREVLGTATDWALGTTWTIEWWSKATTASGPGTIFTVLAQNFDGNGIDIYYQNGNLIINNGTTLTTEPTPGVWTHVSLVNNAGTTTLYYNGTSVYTGGNWNLGNSTNNLMIGKRGPGNFQYFAGKLTNIRITNTAVHTGSFNPYTQALPPTKVAGTKLLMNPTDFNTVLDLSDSAHTFGGSCGAGNDHPGATGFHTYKAVTPNNGTTPGSVYFLRSEYPGIESVPIGATMTGPIFADPNSPVPITASTVWINQLYWYVNYSPTPPGTRATAPGDTFTFTW